MKIPFNSVKTIMKMFIMIKIIVRWKRKEFCILTVNRNYKKWIRKYEEYLYTPSLEINEDNHCLSERKQKVLSPLSEDEIV